MAESRAGPGDLPTSLPSPRLTASDGTILRTIDVHAHAMFPAVDRLTADYPQRAAEAEFRARTIGEASVAYNSGVMLPACEPSFESVSLRLAQMDAMGVDVQVVSPSPSQYHYWAPADLADELVRIQNEGMAQLCAQAPERLVPLGAIAMQHPPHAIKQMRHMIRRLGFKGFEISSTIAEAELSDPRFGPIWAEAEALGALVFIHPMGCSLNERLAPAYLSNSIGQPVEHAVAIGHLIFGGVLDRHPGLKIVAAHGGGYLPVQMGRCDHAWEQRSDAHTCAQRPSTYLKRLHFDTLVHDERDLTTLIERVGASQVVLGTDYPFDMGHYDIHGLLAKVPGLPPQDIAAILGGNIARLLEI